MANSCAADVEVEVASTGIRGCSPQSADIEELKKTLMEQVDIAETARWEAGEVKSKMAPNMAETSLLLPRVTEMPTDKHEHAKNLDEFKWNIVWGKVFSMIFLHAGAIYGLYLAVADAKFATTLWGLLYGQVAFLGTTAGAHRLWAHRAYKATWQLRLLLITLQTACYQGHIYAWARDHRMHHKYTDTSADPNGSQRGFFFAHIGWTVIKKHPDVINKGKHIDMSDITQDRIAMFQKKYYMIMASIMCVVFPTLVPWFFWNESWWSSFFIAVVLRTTYFLHISFLVNSVAHFYGYRPYNNSISAVQNRTVSYLTLGEGWHNYHHVFPWDYKTGELPTYEANWTLAFIHKMANIGWAYDLKTVPPHLVAKRALRTGDGSHFDQSSHMRNDDAEDDRYCKILYRKKK